MYLEKITHFSKFMLEKLEQKQYENGDTWDVCSTDYLLRRMHEEINEVKEVLKQEPPAYAPWDWDPWQKRLALECADVANFAMMIADRLDSLGRKKEGERDV